jgi:UDP-N-acetylmuramoyl-tripeptide--D-alanyl-D-alanine ligase
MTIWTSQEAAAATQGKLIGNPEWEVFGISIDSRLVKKGDLFVALKGTKTDGHDYLREAFLKGANAVMVERPANGLLASSSVLQVPNCIEALYHLSMHRRANSHAKFIGVTGSVGKTSTKELLNLAFSSFGITHATQGNNNNDIGVPLTLARMPLDTDYAIIEMGMNHAGEISPLSQLAKPDISIITNVEEVHIENFENIQGIADAKAEIFDGMAPGSTAILNADNQFFDYLTSKANEANVKIVSFGISPRATVKMKNYSEDAKEATIFARIGGKDVTYTLQAKGRHMALNSLVALAAVHALGLDVNEAAENISQFAGAAGRGQILQVPFDGGKITVIDDSYNASPVSMRAALSNLGALTPTGRRIAVLGDMLELGNKSAELHKSLLSDILHNNVDLVFTVGPMSKLLFDTLPQKIKGEAVASANDILPVLQKNLKAGDAVLIKSSHGTGLYKTANDLTHPKEHAI